VPVTHNDGTATTSADCSQSSETVVSPTICASRLDPPRQVSPQVSGLLRRSVRPDARAVDECRNPHSTRCDPGELTPGHMATVDRGRKRSVRSFNRYWGKR